MHNYQAIILLSLIALIASKASRYGALVILLELSIYYSLISDLSAIYYYSCTATLNLFVGLVLHNRYKLAALCAYALVFANLYGFFIWYQYIDPVSYDIISGILLTAQLLFLLPKGFRDAIRHYAVFSKPSVVQSADFDSSQPRVTISKTTNKKTQK